MSTRYFENSSNVREEKEEQCEEVEVVITIKCVKTVADNNWLEHYIQCLPKKEESTIKYLFKY